MNFRGTVKDEAARTFAGFTYRKPIIPPVDIWSLDPERLHPAHEYPRSVNPPSHPHTPYVELADYDVTIGSMGPDGMNPVQVWMLPNEFTAAMKPMQVCEFRVSNALTLRHEYVDEALKRAFEATQPTGRKDE